MDTVRLLCLILMARSTPDYPANFNICNIRLKFPPWHHYPFDGGVHPLLASSHLQEYNIVQPAYNVRKRTTYDLVFLRHESPRCGQKSIRSHCISSHFKFRVSRDSKGKYESKPVPVVFGNYIIFFFAWMK